MEKATRESHLPKLRAELSQESFPGVLLEMSLLHFLPVIQTRSGPQPDLLSLG